MLSAIGDLSRSIDVWNDNIARLSEQSAEREEDEEMAEKRQEYVDLVNKARKKIEKINKLHNYVTKFWATPKHRIIGFVLHVEPSPSVTKPTSSPTTGH